MSTKKITSPSYFIGKSGDGIISFGSGQPDLPPPERIFDALRDFRDFKYGLVAGREDLRCALARTQSGFAADDFVITNGASEAMDLVFRAIGRRHPKGKVLLARPYYYSYPYVIEYANLKIVYTDLVEGRVDLADFKKKVKGCVAVFINSPGNPTGRVELPETLREIEKITKKEGALLISDEVYKDLIYKGAPEHYSPRGKHVVTLDSFSKTYSMCGYRVGYLFTKNAKIVSDVLETKVHTSMNTDIAAQHLALCALSTPRSFIDSAREVWQERCDLMYSELSGMGLKLDKPEGAFYVLPKVRNSGKVVADLYYDHKIVVYDGAWFGAPGHIRLSYALSTEKIKEGLGRIKKYLKKS